MTLSKLVSQPLFSVHNIAKSYFTMDVALACMWYIKGSVYRAEVSITDHLRDFVKNLENYKAVQNFLVQQDRNKEDYNFLWVVLFLELKRL